jgi:hypothetical protein
LKTAISLTVCALVTVCGSAVAQPVIASLDVTSAARSGRVMVRGSGFGDRMSGGTVTVGGVRAHFARWTDAAISVYIPESAAIGNTTIEVQTASGSASVPVNVTARPIAEGKVLWKFKVDGAGVRHRGQVSEDGTVYASDSMGFLYSLSPSGGLNWIYCADCVNSTGGEGPVSIGLDGTIHVGGNPVGPESNVHAVNRDGTRRWIYTDVWTDCIAGPSIGPEGDVYVVMENSTAGGLTRIDAATGLRVWGAHPPSQGFIERGQTGAEIAFGSSFPGGPRDRVYTTCDMRPQQVPIPQGAEAGLFAFDVSGGFRWAAAVGGQSIAGGQTQGEPAVGPDGTVYECSLLPPNAWALYAHQPSDGGRKWGLYIPPGNVISEPTVASDGTVYIVRNTVHVHAVRPSGSVEWTYTEPTGSLYEAAVESPDGRVVISSGSVGDTTNFSGHIRALSGGGQSLWSVYLPREDAGGTPIVPRTRAFYSPDSRRAYVGTSGSQAAGAEYAYVVALDTAPPRPTSCDGDFNGDGDFGTDQDIEAFFACLTGRCCPACLTADFNGDGDFGTDQDIEAFFRVIAGGNC